MRGFLSTLPKEEREAMCGRFVLVFGEQGSARLHSLDIDCYRVPEEITLPEDLAVGVIAYHDLRLLPAVDGVVCRADAEGLAAPLDAILEGSVQCDLKGGELAKAALYGTASPNSVQLRESLPPREAYLVP
ncbi:MAG TPA: hypothetical protein PK597_00955 [Oscillospiraceae bacterium]|nr:hypothetical protein [Oscillospiraceae bacterium]